MVASFRFFCSYDNDVERQDHGSLILKILNPLTKFGLKTGLLPTYFCCYVPHLPSRKSVLLSNYKQEMLCV